MKRASTAVGGVALIVAVVYLARVVSGESLAAAVQALARQPLGLAAALGCYGAAFGLRTWAWRRALPQLTAGQAWAALHVSLLGNHVLPFRLGEVLRVTSVLRRTSLPARPIVASTVLLRTADLLSVLLLAMAAGAGLAAGGLSAGFAAGPWIAAALAVVGVVSLIWLRQVRWTLPILALGAAAAAWALEAAVVYQIARSAGLALTPWDAIVVTAVTIAAQTVAVTPGGFGSYEAAATAALTALGAPAATAFAVALLTHAVKTAYSLVVGGVALFVPAPSYWGRFRLPRRLPPRPTPVTVANDAPVVAFIPVFNEAATVGDVVGRLPSSVRGRPLITLVIDDGSADASAAVASAAGARVVAQPRNLGLGAAVRRGLAEAVRLHPAAIVYLDADGEYFPEDICAVAAPVLSGAADYVVGSRFIGSIERMLPHRRFGNRVLTWWVRWMTRLPITDGQSGYRAFSPGAAAHAEVIHDYNYAQVLTLDLLAKGYGYREVPIRYAFRSTGSSFIRLGRYLRRVVPAVHRELNAQATPMPGSASRSV